MAYLQTTATSVSDILNTLDSFATGLGWTVERNDTHVADGNRRILSLSRASIDYAHFFSGGAFDVIHTMRSIGIDTSGAWNAQPNRGCYSTSNLLSTGPYANLWVFGEAGANPYIHCVIEHAAGRYRHFGIGDLVKMGTWTGGGYSYGTSWDQGFIETDIPTHENHSTPFSEKGSSPAQSAVVSCIRCDDVDTAVNAISGIDDRYLPYNSGSSRRVGTGLRDGAMRYVDNGMGYGSAANFSSYNQRAHLFRIRHFVTSSGGYIRQIGEPPGIRAITMAPFQAGEELTIGSDIWQIFPIARKGVTSGQESSGDYAFAYKKVV